MGALLRSICRRPQVAQFLHVVDSYKLGISSRVFLPNHRTTNQADTKFYQFVSTALKVISEFIQNYQKTSKACTKLKKYCPRPHRHRLLVQYGEYCRDSLYCLQKK